MIPDAVKKYVEAIVTKRISLVKSRMICADCGKFWECSPQGPCLFECPDCGGVPQCVAYGSNQLQERLSFDCRSAQPLMQLLIQLIVLIFTALTCADCRYQYPEGPVCSWPDSFECRNNWTTQTPPTPTTPPTTLNPTTKGLSTTIDNNYKSSKYNSMWMR